MAGEREGSSSPFFFFFFSRCEPDISHVGIRRRCMHLVVCMMPKTVRLFPCLGVDGTGVLNFCHRATKTQNRDVLEVVFLFLE